VTGSGLPGLHAPAGGDPHADQEAPRRGAHAGTTMDAPGVAPASAPDRACHEACHALSHRHRPHLPVAGGGPCSREGPLLCPAALPGTLDLVAAKDCIGINATAALVVLAKK